MEHVSPIERKIIGKLLDDAASLSLSVSVYDGEEWALKRSVDRAAIEAEIGATDETTLLFRHAETAERVGHVLLIHGNHEDVISDCSDNEAIAALLRGAELLANGATL